MLKLDLQFFAEGEDDLDIDSMMAEFESEWEDEEPLNTEESPEIPETDSEQSDEETPTEEQPQTETTPNPNDDDADKRNRAFADLRRQADENKKYADFIQRLAEDSGVKPDDLLSRYEERRLQDEAEKQQIPVELLKRQTSTESELAQLKEQLFVERLDTQINAVIAKHGADDNLIRSTFEFMAHAGIDPRVQQVDFEKMYRAANLDSILQKEVEKSRQQDLADKKKRQDSASIPNGASVTQSNGELSDEEVDAILAKMDIRI